MIQKLDAGRSRWSGFVGARSIRGLGILAAVVLGAPVLAQFVPGLETDNPPIDRSPEFFGTSGGPLSPLETKPSGLINFDTANMLPRRAFVFSVGQHQNFDSTAGTGNQTYFRSFNWGMTDGIEIGGFYQTYSDPIPGQVNGADPRLRWSAPGVSAKVRLGEVGNFTFAVQGSVEYLHLVSTLFETVPATPTTENDFIIGSVHVPVTFDVSPKLQFHLSPGVSLFPGTLNGTDFYGTIVSLGAGASFQASRRLMAYGSVNVPFGPGGNTIANDRSVVNKPVYTFGGRYNLTPKFGLDLYVTNGFGVTPGTSILSFIPDGDSAFFGLKLSYAPGRGKGYRPSYREIVAKPGQRDLQLQYDGFTLGSASVLPAGSVSGTAFYGTSFNPGLSAAFAFERDVQVEGFLEQYAVDGSLPTRIGYFLKDTRWGSGPNPRWNGGLKVGLMNTRYGDPFSLSARVSAGRGLPGPGQGVLYADLMGTYVFGTGTALTVSPKVTAYEKEVFYGFGLGLNHEISPGLQLIGEVTPVSGATGTVWAAGARYATRDSRMSLDLGATNAIGRNGLGTLVAQDDVKVMLGATVTLGVNPRLSPVGLFGR